MGSSAGYDKLMKTMVNSWRSAWEEELPFYFVQIAPYAYNSKGAYNLPYYGSNRRKRLWNCLGQAWSW